MKKNILYFILLVLGFNLGACSLEEDPKFTYYSKSVFDSKATAEATVMQCYGGLANLYGRKLLIPTICNGTMVARKNSNEEFRAANYDVDYRGGNLTSSYQTLYIIINNSNNIIEGIKESSLPEDYKESVTGHGYFIRGYAYYLLASLWGRAPIQIQPIGKAESLNRPLSSRAEVYAQAESDWLMAAKKLPESAQMQGMASKKTANAYLAKLYFMLASQKQAGLETSNYNSAEELWKKTIEYGEKVKGKDFLESNYADLFGTGVSDSPEIIFQLNYTSFVERGIQKDWNNLFAPYYYSYYTKTINNTDSYRTVVMDRGFYDYHAGSHPGDKRMGTIYLTQYLKETRYKNDKERKGASYPFVYDKDLNLINGRDFMLPGSDPKNPKYDLDGKGGSEQLKAIRKVWTDLGYGIMSDKLFPYNGKGVNKTSVSKYDTNNVILYRNADLLLILADAYNELGNATKSDEYINKVLSRAGLPSVSGMGQEQRREYIFFERMFELTGEPIVFEDIRRRGTEYLKKVIEIHNNSWFVNYRYHLETKEKNKTPFIAIMINDKSLDDNFLKKNLLLPIPQDEIIQNDNINQSDQNFGY